MRKITLNQIVTILITLLTITMNVLASALPLNGQDTGEISDRFDIYFVPAGYVFSIWGLIYLGLIAFTVYQALPSQRDNPLLILVVVDQKARAGYMAGEAGIALLVNSQLTLVTTGQSGLLFERKKELPQAFH